MKKVIIALLIIVLLVTTYFTIKPQGMPTQIKSTDSLLLLVPRSNPSSVLVQGWQNAASELGLHLNVMTDDEFLRIKNDTHTNPIVGIILADDIHKQMTSDLANALKEYVKAGGYLMLIFDAGTQGSSGSPFSDVLGFTYAEGNDAIQLGNVGQTKAILASIGVPPGKCIPQKTNNLSTKDDYCAISSYYYGPLTYQHFKTKDFSNELASLLLTTADHQFIAGVREYGKGKILFVNMPLTMLWYNTDAMLLHVFLHYFAVNMLHLPVLSSVPDGVGGIIMNLHVESIKALTAFQILQKLGLFEQGPYSIDFTAGPGLRNFTDGLGLDIENNKDSQAWMHYLYGLGNPIGSDGGWIHDYYGKYASETNQSEFQKYITMNIDAIQKVLHNKVLEYVPCMGNQPMWATRYLEKEGFLGYYTVSNTGTTPTQNFRDGIFDAKGLWSFPILPLGNTAAIRDFGMANVPVADVTSWYEEATKFAALNHEVHLIYYHPPDILYFPQYLASIKHWLDIAKQLSQQGIFRWYTMVNIGAFLNTRSDVTWNVQEKNNIRTFKATHPVSLLHQTWLIRKESCKKPTITMGNGSIREDEVNWIVTASDEKEIGFTCEMIS